MIVKTVTFAEFAAFADAIDPDGPGVSTEDLSTVALEVLIEMASSPAAEASLVAAYDAKVVKPVFYDEDIAPE